MFKKIKVIFVAWEGISQFFLDPSLIESDHKRMSGWFSQTQFSDLSSCQCIDSLLEWQQEKYLDW